MRTSGGGRHDARTLAAGYSRSIRLFEGASLTVFFVLLGALLWRLAPYLLTRPYVLIAAAASAYLAADVVSGLVHWAGDTWASPRTPLIGPAFVRPFREHHVDPRAITRHDFLETNGNNCFVSLPVQAVALWWPLAVDRPWSIFAVTFLTALVTFVLMTNQFHKWAHLPSPGPLIGWLQRWHVILPPSHHDVHHEAPFHRYYAITTGWTNWLFHVAGVYRGLEWMVTALTGALPRRDDLGPAVAVAVLEADAQNVEREHLQRNPSA